MTLMTADVTEVLGIDGTKGIPLPALHAFERPTVWKSLHGTNNNNIPTINIFVVLAKGELKSSTAVDAGVK